MKRKNILLVGDISVVTPFFNVLDGLGYSIEVLVNHEEVQSSIKDNSFDYAFIYVNSNQEKTCHVLKLIEDTQYTKIFAITDDFSGTTMSNLVNNEIESVIFFPTKKEYIEDLINKHLVLPDELNSNFEDKNIEFLDADHHKSTKADQFSQENEEFDSGKIDFIDNNEQTLKHDEKGLLESKIEFDFTGHSNSEINTDMADKESNPKNDIPSEDIDSLADNSDGITIRPPRLRVKTPVSDILSKKESQMRIKNVPEIIVDENASFNDSKEEKGFFEKVKNLFK